MKRRIRIGLRHLAPSFCQCRKWQKMKNLSIYIFPLPLLLYHPDLYHCQGSIEEKWQNFLEWKVETLNVYGKNFKCHRPDCNRRRIDCLIRKSTSHVDWTSEGDGKDGTRYMEDTRNVSTNGQLSFYKTMPLPWPGHWGWGMVVIVVNLHHARTTLERNFISRVRGNSNITSSRIFL